jgi:hypothetical protein
VAGARGIAHPLIRVAKSSEKAFFWVVDGLEAYHCYLCSRLWIGITIVVKYQIYAAHIVTLSCTKFPTSQCCKPSVQNKTTEGGSMLIFTTVLLMLQLDHSSICLEQ